MKAPITFVVSTGRAGSTLLSRMLALHPQVLSISEFFSVLQGVIRRYPYPDDDLDGAGLWRLVTAPDPLADAMVRDGQAVPEMFYPYGTGRFKAETGIPNICHSTLSLLSDDPDRLYDELAARVPSWPLRSANDQYRALFALLAEILGRPVIVERSGGSVVMLRRIRRQFPDARIVFMHRNGPDTALSMSRFPMFKLGMLAVRAVELANLPPNADLNEIQAALPEEFKGILSPPYDLSCLPGMHLPPVQFGERWSEMIEFATSVLAQCPAEIQSQLSYEGLLADPAAELTRLAGFLGVPAEQDWLDASAKLIGPNRAAAAREHDAQVMAQLIAACEPGKQALAAFIAGTMT
jgi:sulfotransferase family protein